MHVVRRPSDSIASRVSASAEWGRPRGWLHSSAHWLGAFAAMQLGCGHPMGPLTLADLVGLDIVLAVMETMQLEFGDNKYRPHPLLRKYVDAGWLGRKSGRGFYNYGE